MKEIIQYLGKVAVAIAFVCLIVPVSDGASVDSGSQPRGMNGNPSLFKFIKTVQVTPDEAFQTAGLGLIYYVPATDRLLVFLAAEVPETPQGCLNRRVHAYKEYTLDMQPTGNYGVFNCWGGDAIVLMVDNSLYFAADGTTTGTAEGTPGWWFFRYDAVTWQQVGTEFHVDVPNFPAEHTDGPSLAYVNGMIDLFDVYAVSGQVGSMLAPKHHFFTPDLQPLEVRALAEGPAMYGASLKFIDGVYHYLTSTAPEGDLVVRRYDQNWNFLDEKTVRQHATLTSTEFDGQRFYVAFMDNSQRAPSATVPAFSIHLAVFDPDWNLIEDIPVTTWSVADGMQTDSPGVRLHGGRLYVTYTAHEVFDLETYEDCPNDTICRIEAQAYVSVYELFLRANPAQGTIGTEMTVFGSGFGTGKGKAFVGEAPLKVLEWKDDSIRSLLTKAIPPDIYNVTIQPRAKGSTPITIDHGFTVKRPEIGSLDPPGGSAGDQITIHGFFFGTKKGKVTLGGKNCKVLSWTMDKTTGESSIRMVVPKGLSPGANELKVTNGVGTGTASFTVE